jgi:hypothetical protein
MEYYPLIRELPDTERPRERLKQYGAASLSNSELVAIILRTGAASESVLNLSARLLTKFRGLAGLAKAGFGELWPGAWPGGSEGSSTQSCPGTRPQADVHPARGTPGSQVTR